MFTAKSLVNIFIASDNYSVFVMRTFNIVSHSNFHNLHYGVVNYSVALATGR